VIAVSDLTPSLSPERRGRNSLRSRGLIIIPSPVRRRVEDSREHDLFKEEKHF
jgi:hypothetical protein